MSFSHIGKMVRTRSMENPKTGKTVIVALDHGVLGVPEGFAVPQETLERVITARPDGLLVTPGLASTCQSTLVAAHLPLVMAVDRPLWNGSGAAGMRLVAGVETAAQAGASCIKTMIMMDAGPEEISDNLHYLSALAVRCEAYGIPLMVEPVAWALEKSDPARAATAVLDGCRMAVEMGADILKVGAVAGSVEMLVQAVRQSPVPVTVLGGSRREPEALLNEVRAASSAGAWGVVVGRNVWNHPHPADMVSALRQAVTGR